MMCCSKCGGPSLLEPAQLAGDLRSLAVDAAGLPGCVERWLNRLADQLEGQLCPFCVAVDPIRRAG